MLPTKPELPGETIRPQAHQIIPSSLDLRGARVDEALEALALFQSCSGELDESLEEPGVRLANPETRGAHDHVDVERLARPRLHRGALIAGDPDEQAGRPQALEAVERVGVEILERVGDPVRHRRSL